MKKYAAVISDTPEIAIKKVTYLTNESRKFSRDPFIRKFEICEEFLDYLARFEKYVTTELTAGQVLAANLLSEFIRLTVANPRFRESIDNLFKTMLRDKLVYRSDLRDLGFTPEEENTIIHYLEHNRETGVNAATMFSLIRDTIIGNLIIITDDESFRYRPALSFDHLDTNKIILTTPFQQMSFLLNKYLDMHKELRFTLYQV